MKMSAPPLQPNNTSISVSKPSWKPLNLVPRRMGNLSNKYSKDESLFKCPLCSFSSPQRQALYLLQKVRLSGSTNSAGN